ncbi:inter-alpha-trypsin inhibitor heavy chain H4-like [Acanthaster planci]|uniref:Inter-alpha-trypsin inhibitor heavy chain H4-like n=1 Tax=Acanthaster planci TaxID=133434 RepID=A0A8B7ZWE0_ACAPL|nr:inter-alpha-trypsin inhibitor heavy chain H4-like [Acanthaster planci]
MIKMLPSPTPVILGLVVVSHMLSGIQSAFASEDWIVEASRNSKQKEMPSNHARVKRQSIFNRNEIEQFQVESKIAVRFASTTITSRIRNRASSYQSLNFVLQLPLNAFIANFSL